MTYLSSLGLLSQIKGNFLLYKPIVNIIFGIDEFLSKVTRYCVFFSCMVKWFSYQVLDWTYKLFKELMCFFVIYTSNSRLVIDVEWGW
jgi:hypothetical protein